MIQLPVAWVQPPGNATRSNPSPSKPDTAPNLFIDRIQATPMGRDFENRKNAIFKTAASKSKLYAKYGKQVYVLAKNGVPDPEANPALRNLI